MASERSYDVVVFGCTGNAGRATALSLIKTAPSDLRIALAGRNVSKVEALRTSVCAEINYRSPVSSIGIIKADASDATSMLAMAKSTRVLISCAGPYAWYGEASVVACIAGGAHYVDITGEVPWVNRMINTHGVSAKDAGVTLLSFCGYDCVPAELGMYLACDAIGTRGGGVGQVEFVFRSKGGGFPKGTLNTILNKIEGKNKQPRRAGDIPYVPKTHRTEMKRALGFRSLAPRWSAGQFTGPNFMATINVPVICRSASGLQFGAFDIYDRMSLGKPSFFNLWGLLPVLIYQIALFLFGLLLLTPCCRWLLKRRLKTYSFGGTASGYVVLQAEALSKDGATRASACFTCSGDPGIYATGLLAAAVSLSLLKATSPGAKRLAPVGFSTPVLALRDTLVDELRSKPFGVDIQVRRH